MGFVWLYTCSEIYNVLYVKTMKDTDVSLSATVQDIKKNRRSATRWLDGGQGRGGGVQNVFLNTSGQIKGQTEMLHI